MTGLSGRETREAAAPPSETPTAVEGGGGASVAACRGRGRARRVDRPSVAVMEGGPAPTSELPRRAPEWIRERRLKLAELHAVKSVARSHRLSTVCEEARCPNRSE